MLGMSCIAAYEKQYPWDRCGVDEEADRIIIEAASGRRAVCEPDGETGEAFMDRLERSHAAHRNLFFVEWERCLTLSERLDNDSERGLSATCVEAYRDQYPDEDIRHTPGQRVVIYWTDERYPGGQFICVQPADETNVSFFQRLQRSRREGRNLFHEEWPLDR